VRRPEDEGHPHPVKAAFMIFGQLFALSAGLVSLRREPICNYHLSG
jgi:hypothetical protein